MKQLKIKQATYGILLFITGVAFFVRVSTLTNQSLWRDEVDTILLSDWPLLQLIDLDKIGHNGPLFFLLMRPWRYITGNHEFALRYPAAVFGTLIIPLGYILAQQLGLPRRVGLIIGLLLATSPYLVWYGQEAKMYAMLVVLITIAFIAYLRALQGRGKHWWFLFVILTSLSFYIHILSPLILLVYGITAYIRYSQWRNQWRAWSLSLMYLTCPYLPLVLWQAQLLWVDFESGHPFYDFPTQVSILLQVYSGGLIRQTSSLFAIIIFVFLLLCGLWLPLPKNTLPIKQLLPARLILISWLIVPTIIIHLISLRVAVFEDRYLIYITPAFYMLVALGVTILYQYNRGIAIITLTVILVFNGMSLWHHQHQTIKADFKGATAYLKTQNPQTIMIQIPYLQHTLNYYYPIENNYTLLNGLWTNGDKSAEIVDQEMRQLTNCLTDLWLVVSEEAMWDNRAMTRTWLNEQATLVKKRHFMRVDLYYYEFGYKQPLPNKPMTYQTYLPFIQQGYCLQN